MNTAQPCPPQIQISRDKLLLLVRAAITVGNDKPNPETDPNPGPWDPVIRLAVEKTGGAGTSSRDAHLLRIARRIQHVLETINGGLVGPGGFNFGAEVALNPQPLPPRWIFIMELVQAVVNRAELLYQVAEAHRREGDDRAIIIVSGYVSRFVDDICPTGFKLKWPGPGPRPHWFSTELSGMDLLVMASQFDQAAEESFGRGLQQSLADASGKLAEAGLSRM